MQIYSEQSSVHCFCGVFVNSNNGFDNENN